MYKYKKQLNILKKLFFCISLHKILIISIFLLLMLNSILEIFFPIFTNIFINYFLMKIKFQYIYIILFSIVFIFLQFLSVFIKYNQNIFFSKISLNIVKRLRINIMKSILYTSLYKFNKYNSGKFISLIINDIENIKDFYISVIPTFFKSICNIILLIFIIFYLKIFFIFVMFLIFPILGIIIFLYKRYSIFILQKIRNNFTKLNNFFINTITGITTIQQFQQQNFYKNLLNNINCKLFNFRIRMLKLDLLLVRPLITLLLNLFLYIILFIYGLNKRYIKNIGIIYSLINYIELINESIIELISQQSTIQKILISAKRIFVFLKKNKYSQKKKYLKFKEGNISFKKIFFSYKKDKFFILKNINMLIPCNSFVALVGKTGSGKSTIANLLMGFYIQDSGKIFLGKNNINKFNSKELQRCIGIIQQDPVIISTSIFENITLGRNISVDKVWEILYQVNLKNFICSLPNNIFTKISNKCNIFSVGQKQLLCFARLLVEIPKIIILDEVTANVDYNVEKIICRLVKNIYKSNNTLIVITHKISSIIHADKIFVLNLGKIVEKGKHRDLLNIKGYYYNIYNLQRKKYRLY